MGTRISVVIPTKGRSTELSKVLSSLAEQTVPVHEVIIVDDSANPQFESNAVLVQGFLSLRPVPFIVSHIRGHGVGMTEARNHGAEITKGEVISFLDDDVVLDPGYYGYVLQSFGNPEVAGVTGLITNSVRPNRKFELFTFLTFNSMTSRRRGFMRRSGYPCYLMHCDVPTNVQVMSGCNMCFRREVFLKHRSDERLAGYSYLEDADLTYRVSRRHLLTMDPRCRLVHNSADKAVTENYYRVRMSYHRYLFEKNMGDSPLNTIPFLISVIGDLILATSAAIRTGDRRLITSAIFGLTKDARP